MPDERWLPTTAEIGDSRRSRILTSSNAVPHFFPGVKTEVFHGFDAGKPRHIYIRGFFDLYCTTGPRDTQAFEAEARRARPFRRARDRLAEARSVHARACDRRTSAAARAAGDPLSLDVLAVLERGTHPLRH